MKKIICLPFLLLLVTLTTAQTKPQFSIFGGPQMSTARYTIHGQKQSTSSKFGFQLGTALKVPFDGNLYFAPAFFYSLKGYKVDLNTPSFPPDTAAINNNTNVHTVEIGFLLQYDFSKKANHFFLRAGPSFDFQLFGKEKFQLKNNSTVNQNMKFSFGDYGHYSANILLQLGYETKNGFLFFGQFTHGMANISNADAGPYIGHRVFNLSVGKYLTCKKNRRS